MNGAGSDAGRADDHGVLHGAVRREGVDGLGHRRALLADGDVDALHALALLVDDGVDGDGGLARLAVADDQLALAPTDRGHGVDGLDPGLEGLLHRLAVDDARRLDLEPAGLGRGDGALAVDGLAQGVDHPAEQPVADRHRQDPPGGPDESGLLRGVGVAPRTTAPIGVLVEVQGEPERAVLELEQLVDRRIGQAA